MTSRSVYITPDKKVTVVDRKCVEVALPDQNTITQEEFDQLLEYLQRHGEAYPHADLLSDNVELVAKLEAFFWIPPVEDILEEIYKDAPEPILDAIHAAFIDAKEKGAEDYGYVLIGFF